MSIDKNFCPGKNKITGKARLSENVWKLTVEAPCIAGECRAGQFVILRADADFGERIPLTIADSDDDAGTITMIFQVVGATTKKLSHLGVGDCIADLLGPLGRPTIIRKVGRVVCVGGGIGAAPLYPIVRALKAAGNEVTVILGARTGELLVFEEEMRAAADRVIVCTDDGSRGIKALVTAPLKELCEAELRPDQVFSIGPPIMMKFCCEVTRPFSIPTVVSLNTIMVDGTGMCGCCRVTVGGEIKFVCVDGPEFDGHKVDFDNMMKRMHAYDKEEAAALEREKNHECNLKKMAAKLEAERDGKQS